MDYYYFQVKLYNYLVGMVGRKVVIVIIKREKKKEKERMKE